MRILFNFPKVFGRVKLIHLKFGKHENVFYRKTVMVSQTPPIEPEPSKIVEVITSALWNGLRTKIASRALKR
jgi:hypothetical protein